MKKNLVFLIPLLLFACTRPAENKPLGRISPYAPPVVPHEDYDVGSCFDCHQTSEMDAPMIPHERLENCKQCHVRQFDVPLFKGTAIITVPKLKRSSAKYKKGPPAIPHTVFMREKCLACHGHGSSRDIMKSLHQERVNCRQCHVESVHEP